MKKLFTLFLFTIFCFFIACKKPAENKLAGNWKIDKVFVNGTDRTGEIETLYIEYYQFTGWESSKSKYDTEPLLKLMVDTLNAHWEDSCYYYAWYGSRYEINKDRSEIGISSIGCLNFKSIIPSFVGDAGVRYNEKWRIIKWKRNDFWIELNFGGNTYETRFKKINQ